MNLSKPVRIALTIIGFAAIALSIFITYKIIKDPSLLSRLPMNQDSDVEESNDDHDDYANSSEETGTRITDKFLDVADEVTFEQIKNESPDLSNSTRIVNTDDRKRFESEVLKNRTPQDQVVMVMPEGNSTEAMIIYQGDYVTFMNTTTREVQLQDLNIESKKDQPITIASNDSTTIGFDFLGEYNYMLDGKEFKVIVNKYEE